MIPIKHDPGLDCCVCAIVCESLDTLVTELGKRPEIDRRFLDVHLLGSICAWWVANALEHYDHDPLPLFSMFGDILQEHGVDVLKLKTVRDDLVARTYGPVQ